MSQQISRRGFLRSAASSATALGASGILDMRLSAADAQVNPGIVQLRPKIRPLVRLIDQTPRKQCVQMLAAQLRNGVPFRQLFAAAFLNAVGRGGHHSVYLMHSAYQMTLDVRAEDRLLPLFWAVDLSKEHLHRFKYDHLPPLQGRMPTAARAAADFDAAMQKWDRDGAARAVIAMSRSMGARAAMERLWHYGARDWSFIGHLPIAVANCHRTLHTIGWQHAEPVLRYLIHHLHQWNNGHTNGQSYQPNLVRVRKGFAKLPAGWAAAQADTKATLELLGVIRQTKWQAACDWAYRQLTGGKVRAGTVWDAVHLAAAEFMVRFSLGGRRLGNRALHSNTCTNALHYAFRHCADDRTRFLILLQAVAWVTDFTRVEDGRKMLRKLSITEMPAAKAPARRHDAIDAIFSALPPRPFGAEIRDRSAQDRACRLAFAYAQKNPNAQEFLQTARQLVCRKATLNAHDYKLPLAMFEDLNWVNSTWRPHILAASVHFLQGTRMADNPVIRRARAVLAKR